MELKCGVPQNDAGITLLKYVLAQLTPSFQLHNVEHLIFYRCCLFFVRHLYNLPARRADPPKYLEVRFWVLGENGTQMFRPSSPNFYRGEKAVDILPRFSIPAALESLR